MRTLSLSTRTAEDWGGKFVTEASYDTLVNEDCTVLKPDGSPLMVLLKGGIPREDVKTAWGALKDYRQKTNNRGLAAGTGYMNSVKEDGTVSNTNRAPLEGTVGSGLAGYFERTARFPFCRPCAWNLAHPDKFEALLPMLKSCSELFKQHVPGRYQFQKDLVDKTNPAFVIPGSVFTTLTINKNFRTACHKDAGDLPGGFSCMALMREGLYEGANLVFPDFRVAAKLDTGDLILFDPHEFHGNTMIVPLSEKYQRCTVVMYYREGVQFCGSTEEELARVKSRIRGTPLH